MQEDQYPINIELKRQIIKNFCDALHTELLAAVEEGRTAVGEVFHLKNDMISTGIVKMSITLPMDLEGGFIALEEEVSDFKLHKDL